MRRGKEVYHKASQRVQPAHPAHSDSPSEKALKTVYFSPQGPRSNDDRELYQEALRMMQNIENFASQAAPQVQASPEDGDDQSTTAVLTDQPCSWEGSQAPIEMKAHAVVKVDTIGGQVLSCHALQASSEVESFTFRRGDDGARLYDWTERDGNRKIHVYTGNPEQIESFLVIVQEKN